MSKSIGSSCAALALTILAAVFCSSGCAAYDGAKETAKELGKETSITSAVGINATGGEYTEIYEDHGGFHGDGTTYSTVKFSDDTALNSIKENENWKELPLSDNVNILLYGVTNEREDYVESIGPYVSDADGNPLAPEIENGYYFFMDRQAEENEDKYDDSKVLDRGAYNFTVAVYDTDTDVMHYFKMDT